MSSLIWPRERDEAVGLMIQRVMEFLGWCRGI